MKFLSVLLLLSTLVQAADSGNRAGGPQGPTGTAGTNGSNGATGPQGAAGAQGVTGPTGPQGATGSTGSTGSAGVVAATAPLNYNSGTQTVSIQQADASHDGYLTLGSFNLFTGKEPAISSGSSAQYWRGDKTFQTLNTSAVPELTNLYYTQARVDSEFDTRLATKSTSNLAEGTNLYFTDERAIDAVFSRLNYIQEPDAEVDASGYSLYDDSGRSVSAFVSDQDITYTSTTSGGGGNGQTITYSLGSSPYAEPPIITCPTGSSVTVTWYNGPTLAQNPTATVLKAAWDSSCAATMATAAITGTASNRQYQTGTVTLGQGGDTAPVNGIGGTPSNLTFTRSTSFPLVGNASFDLGKGTSSQQGMGVSTDFAINSADRGNVLQLSLYYSGSASFAFGAASDVQIFIYDKTNAVMLPLTKKIFTGVSGNVYRFAAQFTASPTSTDYRLIFHVSTANASAWDLKLDSVTVDATLDVAAATDVPKLMMDAQPINGSVTDHMAVMWTDGASAWVPATMGSASDFTTLYGFATNLVGLTANITIRGALNGFSFGPFVGYNQYVDTTAGGISPLPASFTDAYVVMGKGLSSDTIMVEPHAFNRLITSKGGLLSNGGLNNGTGDVVVAAGTTGQFLRYNTALTNGLGAFTPVATSPIVYTAATSTWSLGVVPIADGGTGLASTSQNFAFIGPTSGAGAPTWRAIVAGDIPTLNQSTTGSAATITTARTIAGTSFNGSANIALANKFIVQGTADAGLSGPQFLGALATGLVKNTTTTGVLSIAAAADVTGQLLTGFVSGAGTVAATDSILQGFNKVNGNNALNAPLASPVFTGDVNASTGNVLISTIGKGLQVKTGTNSKIGTAVLSGGTILVANTAVTANSIIFLTTQVSGSGIGAPYISAKVAGTSFTISSTNVLDTSTVGWMIVEKIP